MDWAEAIRAAVGAVNDSRRYLATKDPLLPEDLATYVLEGDDPGVLSRVNYEHGPALGTSLGQLPPVLLVELQHDLAVVLGT